MQVDTRKLRNIQRAIASGAKIKDEFDYEEITKVAGFDVAFEENRAICTAIVMNIKTLEILEVKTHVKPTPMKYIPGYLAFREGPLILETYYDLEIEPDLLIVDGHGIAHPLKCGLATYVGVELNKPTLGVARSLIIGEVNKENNLIQVRDFILGKQITTKAHAKPLFVSPGNYISVETAAKIVEKLVIPPHKMPEPLHVAHKLARREMQKIREKETTPQDVPAPEAKTEQTEIILEN